MRVAASPPRTGLGGALADDTRGVHTDVARQHRPMCHHAQHLVCKWQKPLSIGRAACQPWTAPRVIACGDAVHTDVLMCLSRPLRASRSTGVTIEARSNLHLSERRDLVLTATNLTTGCERAAVRMWFVNVWFFWPQWNSKDRQLRTCEFLAPTSQPPCLPASTARASSAVTGGYRGSHTR